jgi:phosphate/sulfate permease
LREQHLLVKLVAVVVVVGLLGQRLLEELGKFLALMEHENSMLVAVAAVVLVLIPQVLVLLEVEMALSLGMA